MREKDSAEGLGTACPRGWEWKWIWKCNNWDSWETVSLCRAVDEVQLLLWHCDGVALACSSHYSMGCLVVCEFVSCSEFVSVSVVLVRCVVAVTFGVFSVPRVVHLLMRTKETNNGS